MLVSSSADTSRTPSITRPETITGRKLHALSHMGMLHWRPKDLNDLRLLCDRVPMEAAALRSAVAAYLADLGRPAADAR